MFRWERLLLDTNRGSFEVFTAGRGDPMCVTHLYSEFNETGDNFAEKLTLERQVFLVNLKEAGNSTKVQSADELSMTEAVEDLEAIRSALGFQSWDFAGHSTGGMLGLIYAITKETSLRSLILVGAAASREYASTKACIYHPDHPQFNHMQELIELLKSPNLLSQERNALAQERTKLSLYNPDCYPEYFSGRVTKKIAVKRLNYFSTVDYPKFDVRSQLNQIMIPTLIACGRYDVQCPLWCSMEMQQGIEGANLVIFEQSNHYPFLEEETRFSQEIHAFLRT